MNERQKTVAVLIGLIEGEMAKYETLLQKDMLSAQAETCLVSAIQPLLIKRHVPPHASAPDLLALFPVLLDDCRQTARRRTDALTVERRLTTALSGLARLPLVSLTNMANEIMRRWESTPTSFAQMLAVAEQIEGGRS